MDDKLHIPQTPITMKPNTTKIVYWAATILFALLMLLDAYGGLSRQEAAKEGMIHLGYPMYILTIVGIAKILGAIAILQTKYQTIKEWAFAGFAINFIGASASRAFAGDGIGLVTLPLVILAVLLAIYFLWKKYETIKAC